MKIKCIKDTEAYWTEGEMYPARIVTGGFVQVGDDDDPKGKAGALHRWNIGKMVRSFIRSVGLKAKFCLRRVQCEIF
ncbi:hypothetical protein SB6417_00079 [Klebsiella pasteurii]|nr:hypothetical protein SB6417_00079 [Klebsiella pasteurii]